MNETTIKGCPQMSLRAAFRITAIMAASAWISPAFAARYARETLLQRSSGSAEEVGKLTLRSGNQVRTRILVPKSGKPAPAMVILAGFQNPTQGLNVLSLAAPVVLASFEYPFYAPKNFSPLGSLRYLAEAKRAAHETLEALGEFRKVLSEHPSVDPKRVTIAGASFGSVFAILGAHRWPETFKDLVLIHGFADVPNTAAYHLEAALRSRIGFLARPIAWSLSHLSWRYLGIPSPEDRLRMLHPDQSVLVLKAATDSYIPEEVSESLWIAASSSPARSARVVLGDDHVDGSNRPLIDGMAAAIESWMSARR